MIKTWSSAGVLFVALLVSALILEQAQLASANSFADDPVPGGMCGCMSCNCYMVEGDMTLIEEGTPIAHEASSTTDRRSQAAIAAEGAYKVVDTPTPARTSTYGISTPTSAPAKTTTTATKTTTATPAKTTTTAPARTSTNGISTPTTATPAKTTTSGSSASSESSGSSGGSSNKTTAVKPANPNTSISAKNSPGSPDDRDTAPARTSTYGISTPVTDPAKAATGKANDSYLYYSSDISNTSPGFTAPYIDKSSYSPQTATPGKNNTFTPATPANTAPGSMTVIQYTYGQAVLEARKNKNDSGAKYEYRTPSGEVRYVDSNGHPLLSPEPATTKTESSAASSRKHYEKQVVRIYENPETALRDAKAFKNDDNTYYGFPADPTDKNKKGYHYFDSNGDYVLEL